MLTLTPIKRETKPLRPWRGPMTTVREEMEDLMTRVFGEARCGRMAASRVMDLVRRTIRSATGCSGR